MKLICPVCGKETDKLIDGICPECFLNKNKPIIDISNKPLDICPICGRIRIKNQWRELSKEFLLKILKNRVKVNRLYRYNLQVISYDITSNHLRIYFSIELKYDVLNEIRTYKIDIPLNKVVCPDCRKISSEYFESIIQIRGNDLSKIEKILRYLDKNFKRYNIYITKIDERDNGIDIYVSESKITRKICQKIKKSFNNVDIKITRKLHTLDRQTSKNVYKQTILIRVY